MMRKVYVTADNVISPLGMDTEENFGNLLAAKCGLRKLANNPFTEEDIPLGALNWDTVMNSAEKHTICNQSKFDSLTLLSLSKALNKTSVNPKAGDVLFLLSTTKGNIDHLYNSAEAEKANLWSTAKLIQAHFSTAHLPMVISNACISGVAAINTAKRLIATGAFNHVVVCGADILSAFVVSGFLSFKSLSATPCKPFDTHRDGLSLGEGAGTLILSSKKPTENMQIEVASGASSNDANHISGPSRTGEGLYLAIRNTLADSEQNPEFISAHGTATPYNDDMESKALKRNALEGVPVNSFKGFIGHTLGAAGTIEAIFGIESMRQNTVIQTLGYHDFGVAEKINVISETRHLKFRRFLKIASGFGGCNAATLFLKHE